MITITTADLMVIYNETINFKKTFHLCLEFTFIIKNFKNCFLFSWI